MHVATVNDCEECRLCDKRFVLMVTYVLFEEAYIYTYMYMYIHEALTCMCMYMHVCVCMRAYCV